MCSIIALLALVLGGFLGISAVETQSGSVPATPVIVEAVPTVVALPTVVAVPTEMVSCAAPSQQDDIDAMLAIVGDAFEPGTWTRQINFRPAKTTGTWLSNALNAAAYLEYLHYDCGVSQAQIDAYYSPEGFAVLLSTYTPYEQKAVCQFDSLKLFQFAGTLSGNAYRINYWVTQVSPTRVAGLMLAFPERQQAAMAEYSGRLFPDLPSCESAAG